MLLLVTQFIYNATLQEGLGMLPFKANYSYELKTLFILKQAKKINKTAKERIEKLI